MNDQDKSKEQLIAELVELRQRVAGERATPELKAAAALFQVAPLGIHECDTEGRITFVNPSQVAITGYTADELVGTYVWDRLAPGPEKDSLPAYFKHLVLEQPAPTPFFAKNIRKSGEVFDVRIDWNYIRNVQGEVTGFVSVVCDITEGRRAEEESARNKAILQAAIESLPFDFFALGPDGRYILQNATSRSHWNEAIGKRPEELGLSEDTLALWLDNNRRAFAGEKVEGQVEFSVHGQSRFFHNVIAPIRDGEEVIGILGVNVDITDRRRAEQELQEANERLELRVLERIAELTTANERLQAEVQQRQQVEEELKAEQRALRRMLLASDHERQLITYELHDGVAQQLMGAIMHFQSQESGKGRKSKATDAYQDGMAALRQASLEIRSVMSRLRTPVLDMYGLTEAIGDLISQLRSAPGAPEIECRLDVNFKRLEPTLENALFRIAQEAMTNACRHSKSQQVHVTLTQKGDDVTLEVRDWGIGFDLEAVQENRFGLEGIRERSRILGGKLSIKTKPGGGTVVRVKFPVIEATDEA